jgi:hypothetical protein
VTQLWAYAARLPEGGALDWGGTWNGNTPGHDFRLLPDLRSDAHGVIARLARAGAYQGRQIDWGAFAIKVDGNGLREVMGLIRDPGPHSPIYLALAESLAPGEEIALVACEL